MNSQGTLALLRQRFPQRASVWQLRHRQISFDAAPKLMGILNVTPDSFSDGGRFFSTERAVEHGLQLASEGADILDVGGESTRPYATPVSLDDELQRVIPVIQALHERTSTAISIDTSKAKVAQEAIAAGAQILNDITGLGGDPQMLDVAAESEVGLCVMHMQGTPQTMQDAPRYHNVVNDIFEFLKARRDQLIARGIEPARICLDPGIGFGKTHQHNVALMAHIGRFHELNCPVLCGHSRKGFIAKLIGDQEADRMAATLGGSLALAAQGIHVLRVHDVLATRHALSVFEACGGIEGVPLQID